MNKKQIKKIVIKAVSVLVIILTILLVGAYIFNLLSGEGKITETFQNWANTNMALAIVLFLVLSPLINLIPGISSIFFITLANVMFNDQTVEGMLKAFALSASSMLLTSSLMFLLGRYGGKRLVEWIIGKEASEKTKRLLTIGGKAALPVVYLLPFFPDDTIALLVGMTDMSFLYNFICTLIFRSIGALVICFLGVDFFDYANFTWWMWLLAALLFLVVFAVLAFLSYQYYRYLKAKEEGPTYYLTYRLSPKKRKSKIESSQNSSVDKIDE